MPISSARSPLRSLAMLAVALFVAGCQANTAPAPKVERPVQVQTVAFANEDAKRDFVGIVRARYETDLGFRVPGKIVARLVNVGDRVRADDVIARLDSQDLQLPVESA
jgi:membrane fusion protein, multidrug efflux system